MKVRDLIKILLETNLDFEVGLHNAEGFTYSPVKSVEVDEVVANAITLSASRNAPEELNRNELKAANEEELQLAS